MEGKVGVDFVIAPHAIPDPVLERHVYGAGDRVPMADAIKYGLVAAPAATEPEKPKRGARRKRADNRSRENLGEDR